MADEPKKPRASLFVVCLMFYGVLAAIFALVATFIFTPTIPISPWGMIAIRTGICVGVAFFIGLWRQALRSWRGF